MTNENIRKFIEALVESLEKKTFAKLTLGNYQGADAHLQKILIRLIEVKKGARLFFLSRYETRDVAKNYEFQEGVQIIETLLGREFFAAHLFTLDNDLQLEVNKKGARLTISKPTFKTPPAAKHNREKQILVDPKSFYLQALGITTETGAIKDKQQDKWRQINKFVETISQLFDSSALKEKREISIVDMGSGKGYLTFAIYDYFNNYRKIKAKVVGVETRAELVNLCSSIARSSDFNDLQFIKGFINDFEVAGADILIALHACNTASDDAIFKGIEADAALIVCAPCCHQELRPQIKPPAMFKDVLKHGSLLERTAETLTDGLRALLLEKSGYQTKVFEFVSIEHTPKNNMIVGLKREKAIETPNINQQIAEIKDFYGIKQQKLEQLLASKV